MKILEKKPRYLFAFLLSTLLLLPLVSAEASKRYEVINLTTNTPTSAPNTDANLVNPWGMLFNKKGHIIVANNGTDLATSYNSHGVPLSFIFDVPGAPTGIRRNYSNSDFKIGTGADAKAAEYLFCTESGQILAYNNSVNPSSAIVAFDNSEFDAVYKGLAIAAHHGRSFLFATDFHNARVDVFDRKFNYVGNFTDRDIPDGYGPFNIRTIDGLLYVTYAKQKAPDYVDDLSGTGNGFVDVFSPSGKLIKRLISRGFLNSPWGLALAPDNFGKFSKALLVGNFGDGLIHAYHHKSGRYIGALRNELKQPIVIEGLWSLKFKHHAKKEKHAHLYFTAGPVDESAGVLGYIQPLTRP